MNSLIVGNWKMHLNVTEAETLVRRLDMNVSSSQAEIVLSPSFVALSDVKKLLDELKLHTKFKLAAQNVNQHDEGAFTGEVSPNMLKGITQYVIVGHSERRIHFGETDDAIAQKIAACRRHKLKPILCVGENLQERKENLAVRTVLDQLSVDLSEITKTELKKLTIAYEPVWAIGTGEFAKPDQVEEMLRQIKLFLHEQYGEDSKEIRILYGGSVDEQNYASYMALSDVNGLLVGGASLNYKAFASICLGV